MYTMYTLTNIYITYKYITYKYIYLYINISNQTIRVAKLSIYCVFYLKKNINAKVT